ncbi:Helix-turn-helix domain-containing protein [Micromonospora nigra]|uniref:Helix-turn-helix domain-containing protein n=1 Tax=Micromonospora nigra TaxID=145857 RepID=A0A1C6SXU7_9ACTN|nr:AraC family transcriptional regulator [Micromonospora nigra]SCL34366.1 Helix-turn-helix domain-containing protein [Micromonospora nigra]
MEQSIEHAVNRAIATMREKLDEQLTVDDMARAAMFSKFHFTRIFQRATGVSPGRFLSALRLQRAKHLLVSTSLNVADISLQVGYNSVGTFSTRFTRSIGMSPTTYRRRAGFAAQIPIDSGLQQGQPSTSRVHGEMRMPVGPTPGAVFLGLFANRIPEGRPVRCTVLTGPGPYSFEAVPPGTWHLLSQSAAEPDGPATELGETDRQILVASEGPLEFGYDTDLRVDLTFQPTRQIDPPVLLALLDSRQQALARVAADSSHPVPTNSLATPGPIVNRMPRPAKAA